MEFKIYESYHSPTFYLRWKKCKKWELESRNKENLNYATNIMYHF